MWLFCIVCEVALVWLWWLAYISLVSFKDKLTMLWLVISYLKTSLYLRLFLLRCFLGSIHRPLNPKINTNELGFFIFVGCLVIVYFLLRIHPIISSISPHFVHECFNLSLCFGFHTWDSFCEWRPRNVDWLIVIDKTTGVHHWLEWSRDVNRIMSMDALFWNL